MWEITAFTTPTPPPIVPIEVLLLHMDGISGSTNFIDATGRHTITNHGNAQISTTKSKFGGASGLFDSAGGGSSGNYLTVDGSDDFVFGTGDFTVDTWFIVTTTNQVVICDFETSGLQLILTGGNTVEYSQGYFNKISGTVTYNDGAFHHIAASRRNGSTFLFLDGVQIGSTYFAFDNLGITSPGPWIGAFSNGNFNPNFLDEFHVVKGFGAWIANFTPPTAPYLP